jgi:signal transduction histidine kinase
MRERRDYRRLAVHRRGQARPARLLRSREVRWPRSRCFRYNAIVVEEEGQPQTARQQLLLALAVAEFVGMLAIAVVVAKLSRQAIRPLATALALQRRFVDDASHELRARVTDTGD